MAGLVRILLKRFTRNVPGPEHRQTLNLCAHVRMASEALLADALGPEAAHGLFAWLRERSFIEQGPHGLFPHDLARDVLDADLRWRNPQAYQAVHRQARHYYDRLLSQTHGPEQRAISADLIYLNRHNPNTKSFFDYDTLGQAYTEPTATQELAAFIGAWARKNLD